jgi:Fe-S-cluster containining protein
MCRLLCIDDKEKPIEIPKDKWIVKDEEYTAIWITIHPNQGNIQGVQLAELTLDESCLPYETFKLNRFAIHMDDLEEFIKLTQDCSGFDKETIENILANESLAINNF